MPLPSVQQRALQVLDLLRRRYPTPATHLVARNPWELLVATVLAAQCTDERVNKVTPHLFALWPDPAALACATQEALEEVIHSTGFYRNKAKNLLGAARHRGRRRGSPCGPSRSSCRNSVRASRGPSG